MAKSNISLLWIPAAASVAPDSCQICDTVQLCVLGLTLMDVLSLLPFVFPLEGKPMSAFESVRPEVLRHRPPDRIQARLSLCHS